MPRKIARVHDAVTEARREGRASALREVAAAYRLFIETDDLDAFRDTLTDLMDAAGLLDETGQENAAVNHREE